MRVELQLMDTFNDTVIMVDIINYNILNLKYKIE